MSEEENKVLSDIHVFTHFEQIEDVKSKRKAVSRFIFELPVSDETDDDVRENTSELTDSDGDLIVDRKQRNQSTHAITIHHNLETVLADVGLQIWSGCLLLCDYMIYNSTEFRTKTILDLGAGCGLTSIIAAMCASKVYCTDYSDEILELARENVELNSYLLPGLKNTVDVRKIDWLEYGSQENGNDLSLEETLEIDIIIAAEVIYDIDLSTALFNTISFLLKSSSKTIFISLEKRLNFSVNDLDVVSPAYSHFRECLDILQSNLGSLEYEELWTITSKKKYPKR